MTAQTLPDPRELMGRAPMTAAQIIVIAITVALNALDGFDVVAISFASPGIATEWGINRAALGIVLSMELLGMSIGSIFVGGIADRLGRLRTALACLVLMAVGMGLASTVHDVVTLCVWRVLTGLGIGGMLATNTAIAAEFSSLARRDRCVTLMSSGYSVGAVLGGLIAAQLMRHGDWRAVFLFGAVVTALMIPIVWWRVPESVAWLCERRPLEALGRVNRSLRRLGHPVVTALPAPSGVVARTAFMALFHRYFISVTLRMSLMYFLHITTFYFVLKWVPKIIVDMGFTAAEAVGVLVWANLGGAIGGLALSQLTQRFDVKRLAIALLVASTVAVVGIGQVPHTLVALSVVCACAGFCTNAGIVGVFGCLARAFPTRVRAAGTGFAIGVGRGGAVLAPIFAGYLFNAGQSVAVVAAVMGVGSLLAALIVATVSLPRASAA